MIDKFNPEYLRQRFPNHNISFVEGKKFSEGSYGKIFASIFGIKNKEYNWVIKKFKDFDEHLAVWHRDRSFNFWKFFYDNKIPTFKKVRKYGEDSIVMERLGDNWNFCVSTTNTNSLDYQYLEYNKIQYILNFEEFLEKGFRVCEKVNKLGVEFICDDVFFILGERKKETKLDFVIGDFDSCDFDSGEINCFQFKYCVEDFLDKFVDKSTKENYKRVLEKIYLKYEK